MNAYYKSVTESLKCATLLRVHSYYMLESTSESLAYKPRQVTLYYFIQRVVGLGTLST